MADHIAAIVGKAALKGLTTAASKHLYEEVVDYVKKKKRSQGKQQQPSSNRSGNSNYIYREANCDGCGKLINDGIRYYCLECPNFDLCENCNRLPFIATLNGNHNQNHRMLQMVTQDRKAFANTSSYPAFNYSLASCDMCGIYPIFNGRYKCRQCPDFDLCERCHNLPSIHTSIKGHTGYHNMVRMN